MFSASPPYLYYQQPSPHMPTSSSGWSWRQRARSVARSCAPEQMLVVAFSGGPGGSEITTLPGGRNALGRKLEKAFPNVVVQKNANSATQIILVPNGVARASSSKMRAAGPNVRVMQIGDFLAAMGRSDLSEEFGIREATDPSVYKSWRGSRRMQQGYPSYYED